ncbi:MAG: hypothetical protein ABEJ25_00625 [Candidatus Bipolaricaulia bacterium]
MSDRRIQLLSVALVLALFLFPTFGYGSNGFSSGERSQVENILQEKYAKLPGVDFDLDKPVASYDNMTFRPYSNLAISVPNLTDGLVMGVVTYGEADYLLMAVKLPQDVDADYGAGLLNLSTGKAVFVAKAELSEQQDSVNKVEFKISPGEEDSPNLQLVVNGVKYELETVIPKSL